MPLQSQAPPTAPTHQGPVSKFLRGAIFLFFGLFAILLPWSIKGARYAWMAAFCLWLVFLIFERKRLRPQPLALPLLAYIVLSAISCALSYEPYMSWPHMKLVCWTALIATLFAQKLERLSQVRVLVLLLLLSATAVGELHRPAISCADVGLKIAFVGPGGRHLYDAGLRPEDAAGHYQRPLSLHSANDIVQAVAGVAPWFHCPRAVSSQFSRSLTREPSHGRETSSPTSACQRRLFCWSSQRPIEPQEL